MAMHRKSKLEMIILLPDKKYANIDQNGSMKNEVLNAIID